VFVDALVGQGIAGSMPQHRQAGLTLAKPLDRKRRSALADKMNGPSPACAFFEVRET
jgi:hypothetical protein